MISQFSNPLDGSSIITNTIKNLTEFTNGLLQARIQWVDPVINQSNILYYNIVEAQVNLVRNIFYRLIKTYLMLKKFFIIMTHLF